MGTLVAGTVGDNFGGDLLKFVNQSGHTLFAVNAFGLLQVDTIRARALALDNSDDTRATIGGAIIRVGDTSVTLTVPTARAALGYPIAFATSP